MDEIAKVVIEQFPTFAGLIILTVILHRQNERLLDEFFIQLDDMQERLGEIEKRLSAVTPLPYQQIGSSSDKEKH